MSNLVGKNPVFVSSAQAVAKSDAVVWIKIGPDADGQRLDNYLFRIAKGVPKSHLYRIVRGGEVRVNKKRVTVDTRLTLGDELRVPPIRVSELPKKEAPRPIDDIELPILYEDEHILVVDKPAGLAAHGGSGISFGLIERLRAARPNQPYLELVHRLDRETSGVMMLAKSRKALVRLHEMIREGQLHKSYKTLVLGDWVNDRQHIKAPLYKYVTASGERRVCVDDDKGKGEVSIEKCNLIKAWQFDNPVNYRQPKGEQLLELQFKLEVGGTLEVTCKDVARNRLLLTGITSVIYENQ